MKTPYLYEYFSIAEGDLVAPGTVALCRQHVAQPPDRCLLLGDVFKDRVNYATGLFNGPRTRSGTSTAPRT